MLRRLLGRLGGPAPRPSGRERLRATARTEGLQAVCFLDEESIRENALVLAPAETR